MVLRKKITDMIGAMLAIFLGYSVYYAIAEGLPHFEGFMTALLLVMLLVAVNRDEEEETEEETEEQEE